VFAHASGLRRWSTTVNGGAFAIAELMREDDGIVGSLGGLSSLLTLLLLSVAYQLYKRRANQTDSGLTKGCT
jgi:hypothetical protein